jgi:hypothetical protein
MQIRQKAGAMFMVIACSVACSITSAQAAGSGGNGGNGSGAGPSGADVSGGGGNNPAAGPMAASGPTPHSTTMKKSTHKSTKKPMNSSGSSADQAKGGG